MITQSIERLDYLLAIVPARLHAIGADEMSRVPAPGKWSKKEIIGHLIDSAANNHQRFIRTQYQLLPDISYAQNEWVTSTPTVQHRPKILSTFGRLITGNYCIL